MTRDGHHHGRRVRHGAKGRRAQRKELRARDEARTGDLTDNTRAVLSWTDAFAAVDAAADVISAAMLDGPLRGGRGE